MLLFLSKPNFVFGSVLHFQGGACRANKSRTSRFESHDSLWVSAYVGAKGHLGHKDHRAWCWPSSLRQAGRGDRSTWSGSWKLFPVQTECSDNQDSKIDKHRRLGWVQSVERKQLLGLGLETLGTSLETLFLSGNYFLGLGLGLESKQLTT